MMTTPGAGRNRKEVSPSWRLLLAFTFLLFSILALFFFLHSSAFAVKEVVVEGNQSLRSAEIVRLTGVVPGTNIFLLNEEEIIGRLALQPMIESVQLVRKLPNRLLVRVQEREPCALLPVDEGFVVVDREGVYLTRVGHMVDISRPVITGCPPLPEVLPGQTLPLEPLLKFIPLLEQIDTETVQLISEVNLAQTEMIKIVTIDGVEIRAGNLKHLQANLEVLKQVLNLRLKRTGAQPTEYVDMSFKGSPVVKFAK